MLRIFFFEGGRAVLWDLNSSTRDLPQDSLCPWQSKCGILTTRLPGNCPLSEFRGVVPVSSSLLLSKVNAILNTNPKCVTALSRGFWDFLFFLRDLKPHKAVTWSQFSFIYCAASFYRHYFSSKNTFSYNFFDNFLLSTVYFISHSH